MIYKIESSINIPQSDLKKMVKFIVKDISNRPKQIDIRFNYLNPKSKNDFDCTFYGKDSFIEIFYQKHLCYPYLVKPEGKNIYIAQFTAFSERELVFFLLAHELRHLIQTVDGGKMIFLGREFGADEDSDADYYALYKLAVYKKKKLLN